MHPAGCTVPAQQVLNKGILCKTCVCPLLMFNNINKLQRYKNVNNPTKELFSQIKEMKDKKAEFCRYIHELSETETLA